MTILFGTSTASMEATGFVKGVVAGAGAGLGFGTIGALVDTGKENLSTTLTVSSAAVGGFIGCISGTKTNTIVENGLIGAGTGAVVSFLASKLVNMMAKGTNVCSGTVGSILLGAEVKNEIMSLDCWKEVVRDNSREKSNGKRLDEILMNENIKNVFFEHENLFIENIWNEKFQIEFFILNDEKIYAHANKI
ncbi:unnamed protein product [Brachionus calyciflorus]|uniref:Uncharacterized protein n=1 Tax=Brachionus calyciflorus TaxID=104777 RepID=A0A814FW66_9BILA|nr:unnamed protein product [Brachionus calyciflorus]